MTARRKRCSQCNLPMLTHRAVVWKLGKHIQLLNGDLINFVDDINSRHVDSAAFNNVHQVINIVVIPTMDIRIVDSVLRAHLGKPPGGHMSEPERGSLKVPLACA
jgi:hypothetical protein